MSDTSTFKKMKVIFLKLSRDNYGTKTMKKSVCIVTTGSGVTQNSVLLNNNYAAATDEL